MESSESNRKRARKTKLVPRTVADDDEDDCLPYYLPKKKLKSINNKVAKRKYIRKEIPNNNISSTALDDEISKYSQDLDFSLAQLAKLKKEIKNDDEESNKNYDIFDQKFSVNVEVEEIIDSDDEQVDFKISPENPNPSKNESVKDNGTSSILISNSKNIVDHDYEEVYMPEKCYNEVRKTDQDSEIESQTEAHVDDTEIQSDEPVTELVEKNQSEKEVCQIQNETQIDEQQQDLEKVLRGSNVPVQRINGSFEGGLEKKDYVEIVDTLVNTGIFENVSEKERNPFEKLYSQLEIDDGVDNQIKHNKNEKVVKQIDNKKHHIEFVDCQAVSKNNEINNEGANEIDNVTCEEQNNKNDNFNLEAIPSIMFPPCKFRYFTRKQFISYNSINLNSRSILDAILEITESSTFPADKILGVHARNYWASIPKVTPERTPQGDMLQHALTRWRGTYWKKTHEPPWAFRCSICKLGWWHFSEFENHINIHNETDFFIDMESWGNEVVLVACCKSVEDNKLVTFKDLTFNSDCHRCGLPYKSHKCFNKKQQYKCPKCKLFSRTCIEFNNHQRICVVKRDASLVSCYLCYVYLSENEYENHLINVHSVRSDVPSHNIIKFCSTCNSTCHDCIANSKALIFRCEFCCRTFRKFAYAIHTFCNKKDVYCKACSEYLPNECMEILHMVEDTPNYTLAYKCLRCSNDDLKVLATHKTTLDYAHEIDPGCYVIMPTSLVPDDADILVVRTTPEIATTTNDKTDVMEIAPDDSNDSGENITPSSPLKYFEADTREADKELEILQNEVHAVVKSMVDAKNSKVNGFYTKINKKVKDAFPISLTNETEYSECSKTHQQYKEVDEQNIICLNEELNECESAVSSILQGMHSNESILENVGSVNLNQLSDNECEIAVSSILDYSPSPETGNDKSSHVQVRTVKTAECTDLEFKSTVTSVNASASFEKTNNLNNFDQIDANKKQLTECDLAVSSILGLNYSNNEFYIDYGRRDNMNCNNSNSDNTNANMVPDDQMRNEVDNDDNSSVEEVPILSNSNEMDVIVLDDSDDEPEMHVTKENVLQTNHVSEEKLLHITVKEPDKESANNVPVTKFKLKHVTYSNLLEEDVYSTSIDKTSECKVMKSVENTNKVLTKCYMTTPVINKDVDLNKCTTNDKDNENLTKLVTVKTEIEVPDIKPETSIDSTEIVINNVFSLKDNLNDTELNVVKSKTKDEKEDKSLGDVKKQNVIKLFTHSNQIAEKIIEDDNTTDINMISIKNEPTSTIKDKFIFKEGFKVKKEAITGNEFSSDTIISAGYQEESSVKVEKEAVLDEEFSSDTVNSLMNSAAHENESSSSKQESFNESLESEIQMVITKDDLESGRFKDKLQDFLAKNKDGWNIDFTDGKVKKVYYCKKCNFKGFHKEFIDHRKDHSKLDQTLNNKQAKTETEGATNSEDEEENYLKEEEENESQQNDEEINIIGADPIIINKLIETANRGLRKCSKCIESFEDLTEYLRHLTKHNLPEQTCPECRTPFNNCEDLILHIHQHVEKMFRVSSFLGDGIVKKRCRECKLQVKSKYRFQHWEHHLKLEGYSGTRLEKQILASILDFIQQPSTRHQRMDRNCLVCEHQFTRTPDYKRHLIEHLLDDAISKGCLENDFQKVCQICGEKFDHAAFFRSHMRDHANMRKYWCDVCNKGFSDSSNFSKHKKVHIGAGDLMWCDICNKRFRCKYQLGRHLQNHEKVGTITCEYCSAVFPVESYYTKHLRCVHLVTKERKLPCGYCSLRFESVRDKWEHEWQKHKKRKSCFDCAFCGLQFRNKRGVINHVKYEHQITQKKIFSTERGIIIEKKIRKRFKAGLKKSNLKEILDFTIAETEENGGLEVDKAGVSDYIIKIEHIQPTSIETLEEHIKEELHTDEEVKETMDQSVGEQGVASKKEPLDLDFGCKRKEDIDISNCYDDEEDMVLIYDSD